MRINAKHFTGSSEPGRHALISATARSLARNLPINEIFKTVAALLDDAFGTASVEISFSGDSPQVYRYGVDAAFELNAAIALPLTSRENEIGTLRIVRKTARQFTAADLACLETVALSIAGRLNEAKITSAKDHYAALAGIDPLTG